jgi:4-amino-4-deoxy-L-arabinose transferase-like glycosyltransferase
MPQRRKQPPRRHAASKRGPTRRVTERQLRLPFCFLGGERHTVAIISKATEPTVSFEHRPSPARVTEAAAAKLPRWMLLALLVAYVVPGLFGRDPWSLEDASSFGVMWTMAQGGAAEWWLPGVLGQPLAEEGPLAFWLGAVMILIFGPVFGAIDAARLSAVIWFALATASLWYATYRLARRTEAQPVALAFGGEASPRDYGRMLADIAVLLMLATLGIVVRLHETSAETALFAWVCALLLALAVALESQWKGALAAGLVLGAAALTRGWFSAGLLAIAAAVFLSGFGTQRAARLAAMLATAVGLFALWPIGATMLVPGASDYFAALARWNADQLRGPSLESLVWLVRNAGWYTWPLWPFALWTLYSWRSFLRRPHMWLPLLVAAAGILNLLLSSTPSDRELIAAVPALILLAAFGVSTLRRGAEDAIDWFSIALFSFALLAAWLYFVAWIGGFPPKMAASVARIVPGLTAYAPSAPIALALAGTAAWGVLVLWRARVRPPMLWRGPVLAAGGLTAMWLVVATIYNDPIEYSRSLKPTAVVLGEQVRRIAGSEGCVQAYQLPAGMRAMLAYHGGIRFGALGSSSDICRVIIHRDSQRSQLDDAPPIGDWQLAYQTTRRARYDEVFRVWSRRP